MTSFLQKRGHIWKQRKGSEIKAEESCAKKNKQCTVYMCHHLPVPSHAASGLSPMSAAEFMPSSDITTAQHLFTISIVSASHSNFKVNKTGPSPLPLPRWWKTTSRRLTDVPGPACNRHSQDQSAILLKTCPLYDQHSAQPHARR